MSDSGKARAAGRLTPRAVRIRNRCVAVLAARRAIQAPSEAELTTLGEDIGFAELWSRWEQLHGARAGAFRRPIRRAASRVAMAAAATLVLAAAYLTRDTWLPRADAQPAAPAWIALTDSVSAELDAKLFAVAASEADVSLPLSPAEVAKLIVRPSSIYRARPSLDSVEARLDTLLWIRGRLRDGSSFVMGGRIEVLRRGIGAYRVETLALDGQPEDPHLAPRVLRYGRAQRATTNRVWFEIPYRFAELRVTGGSIRALPWPRRGPRNASELARQ